MEFINAINTAIESIKGFEEKKARLASSLNYLKEKNFSEFNSKELLEDRFIHRIEDCPVSCRVAGVDSGFIGKNFSSVDLLLVKGSAAVFDLINGVLDNAFYYPTAFSFPRPIVLNNGLERDEFNCAKSLYRLKEEVRLSTEVIEKMNPKYLFIDGSILPQPQDKPRDSSRLTGIYKSLVNDFQTLYEKADVNNCCLISCIEDSRANRFRSILQNEILKDSNSDFDFIFDSFLLDSLLEKGERSFAFRYSNDAGKHPIMKDFNPEWNERMHAFYIKPSHFDRPLRIELLCNEKLNLTKRADEIASIAYSLSSQHKEYAYPSILIEADLRARLRPEEVNMVFDKLIDGIGGRGIVQQRRDKRPF